MEDDELVAVGLRDVALEAGNRLGKVLVVICRSADDTHVPVGLLRLEFAAVVVPRQEEVASDRLFVAAHRGNKFTRVVVFVIVRDEREVEKRR